MSERKYKIGQAVMQNPAIRKPENWWKHNMNKKLTVKQYVYKTILAVNENRMWYKEDQLIPYTEHNLDDVLFEI